MKTSFTHKEALQQLLACGFQCAGGPLTNNVAFRHLCKEHGVELPPLKGFEFKKSTDGR